MAPEPPDTSGALTFPPRVILQTSPLPPDNFHRSIGSERSRTGIYSFPCIALTAQAQLLALK